MISILKDILWGSHLFSICPLDRSAVPGVNAAARIWGGGAGGGGRMTKF